MTLRSCDACTYIHTVIHYRYSHRVTYWEELTKSKAVQIYIIDKISMGCLYGYAKLHPHTEKIYIN